MKKKKCNKGSETKAVLTSPATLYAGNQEGVVRFLYTRETRIPSTTARVYGDTALLKAAWSAGHVTLLVFDDFVRVRVTGFDMEDGALTVLAAPVFKALATRIKNAA